jgi:ActR/RegA family two-component response regulator
MRPQTTRASELGPHIERWTAMEPRQEDLNVLIVDDNKDFTDSLEALLKENRFNVASVGKPEAAIEEFRKKIYHVVLLDLKMPGMSGEDLLKEFKHIDADASVIIMTAYPSIESAVSTIKMDAAAYLTKPFEVDECVAAIREAVASRGIVVPPEREILTGIGATIREVRRGKGLTQGQLANRTNLSRSLISRIESGSAAPSIPSLYKIAVALNVPIGDLFENVTTTR